MAMLFKEEQVKQVRLLVLCFVIILCLVITVGITGTKFLEGNALKKLKNDSQNSLLILTFYVNKDLENSRKVTNLLAASPVIYQALVTANSPETLKQANKILDVYSLEFKNSVVYLMNASGMTIASSNRDLPSSFVGKSYAFSPYFQDAFSSGQGSYFAYGIISKKRGHYSSAAVKNQKGDILGVVVLKRDIDELENLFHRNRHSFLVDKHNVIFLASNNYFVFQSLWSIDVQTQQELIVSQQFGQGPFVPVFEKKDQGKSFVDLAGERFILDRKDISKPGWSIVLLKSTEDLVLYRMIGIILTCLLSVILIIFFLIIYQQKRQTYMAYIHAEQYLAIFDTAPGIIALLDESGRIVVCNDKTSEVLGYKQSELIGRSIFEIFSAEYKDVARDFMQTTLNEEGSNSKLFKAVHKNGNIIEIKINTSKLHDPEKQSSRIICIIEDFTELKRKDELLLSERTRAQEYLDVANVMIVAIGADQNIVLLNKKGCEILGVKEEEVIGKNWFDLFVQEDNREKEKGIFNKLMAGEIDLIEQHESSVITKDNRIKVIHWHNRVLKNNEGKPVETLSSGEDVTHQKFAEEKLKEQMEELRKFHKFAVGRELRMKELKEKIRLLEKQQEKYS